MCVCIYIYILPGVSCVFSSLHAHTPRDDLPGRPALHQPGPWFEVGEVANRRPGAEHFVIETRKFATYPPKSGVSYRISLVGFLDFGFWSQGMGTTLEPQGFCDSFGVRRWGNRLWFEGFWENVEPPNKRRNPGLSALSAQPLGSLGVGPPFNKRLH